MSLNKFIGMGRLCDDPKTGNNYAKYNVAIDRAKRKDADDQGQTADFVSCVAFGHNAEFASNYLHKGQKIVVEGRLQTGSYVNKDGQKVYTTDVIVEHQEFAESKAAEKRNTEAGFSQIENIPIDVDDELPFA